MQYRQLGQSGLLVSELCFGTMPFGAKGYWEVVGGLDQAAAQRLVDIAIDGGINFLTRPMSIPTVSRRRFSAKPCRASVIRWCWPPRCVVA